MPKPPQASTIAARVVPLAEINMRRAICEGSGNAKERSALICKVFQWLARHAGAVQ